MTLCERWMHYAWVLCQSAWVDKTNKWRAACPIRVTASSNRVLELSFCILLIKAERREFRIRFWCLLFGGHRPLLLCVQRPRTSRRSHMRFWNNCQNVGDLFLFSFRFSPIGAVINKSSVVDWLVKCCGQGHTY